MHKPEEQEINPVEDGDGGKRLPLLGRRYRLDHPGAQGQADVPDLPPSCPILLSLTSLQDPFPKSLFTCDS